MKTNTPSLLIAALLAVLSARSAHAAVNLLHSFAGGASDGSSPYGSLTLSGSKLYGMTEFGGSSNNGTLFSINTDGSGFSLLRNFTGTASDGMGPYGSLTLSGSKLYGMTIQGGSSDAGTLFSINTDGSGFELLESFAGAPADGSYPEYGELTLSDDASTLYGMTASGGPSDLGVVFSESIPQVPEPGTAFSGLAVLAGLALRRPRRAMTRSR